jgi:hypothetical protein
MDLTVPLSSLGKTYKNWQQAPLGAVLAFGGRAWWRDKQDWKEEEAPRIALRAEGYGRKCLVVLWPAVEVFAESFQNDDNHWFIKRATGPAVDISDEFQICIDLAPSEGGAEIISGDVILAGGDDGKLFAAVGTYGRMEAFLALGQPEQWFVTDRPHQSQHVGKLTVRRVHTKI